MNIFEPIKTNRDPVLNNNDLSNSFVEIAKLLSSVDTTSPEAKLNETSINDNNGGRIIL